MGKKAKPPGETRVQKTNADIGIESSELGKKTQPIKDDLYKRISDFRQETKTLKDRSSNDAAIAYHGSDEAVAGRSPLAIPRMSLTRGASQAAQAVSTGLTARRAGIAGSQGLADMAMGERGEAMKGIQELAIQQGNEAVMRARNDAAASRDRGEAVAGLAGAGLAMYKRKPITTADDYAIGGAFGPRLDE